MSKLKKLIEAATPVVETLQLRIFHHKAQYHESRDPMCNVLEDEFMQIELLYSYIKNRAEAIDKIVEATDIYINHNPEPDSEDYWEKWDDLRAALAKYQGGNNAQT